MALTSRDCLRKARRAYHAVAMAKVARTVVATAVSWVAKMSDIGEGYGSAGDPRGLPGNVRCLAMMIQPVRRFLLADAASNFLLADAASNQATESTPSKPP